VSRISAAHDARSLSTSFADFLELTKPGIAGMVALTSAAGFYLATDRLEFGPLSAAVFGTALLAAGANTVNQYAERDLDAMMVRTRSRPLPAGRLAPGEAIRFGTALSASGACVLLLFANALTALLGSISFLTYIVLYTPLKRRSSMCTPVGAISGAMPPLMGWAAARGHIDLPGLSLFALLFLWQMPHFFAIGWSHADDYARAGFRVPGRSQAVRWNTVLYCAALIPVSAIPAFAGTSGLLYLLTAVVLGGLYLWHGFLLAACGSNLAARRLFRTSLLYLAAVLLMMVLNKQ